MDTLDPTSTPESVTPGEGQDVVPATEVLPRLTSQLPRSVPETVTDLAIGRSRGIGSDALQLASAYMNEVRVEIDDLKSQLRDSRDKNETLQERLRTAEIANAELRSQVGGQRRLDNIMKLVGVAAAAIAGVGVDLYKSGGDNRTLGIVLVSAGLLGILLTGLSALSEKK